MIDNPSHKMSILSQLSNWQLKFLNSVGLELKSISLIVIIHVFYTWVPHPE